MGDRINGNPHGFGGAGAGARDRGSYADPNAPPNPGGRADGNPGDVFHSNMVFEGVLEYLTNDAASWAGIIDSVLRKLRLSGGTHVRFDSLTGVPIELDEEESRQRVDQAMRSRLEWFRQMDYLGRQVIVVTDAFLETNHSLEVGWDQQISDIDFAKTSFQASSTPCTIKGVYQLVTPATPYRHEMDHQVEHVSARLAAIAHRRHTSLSHPSFSLRSRKSQPAIPIAPSTEVDRYPTRQSTDARIPFVTHGPRPLPTSPPASKATRVNDGDPLPPKRPRTLPVADEGTHKGEFGSRCASSFVDLNNQPTPFAVETAGCHNHSFNRSRLGHAFGHSVSDLQPSLCSGVTRGGAALPMAANVVDVLRPSDGAAAADAASSSDRRRAPLVATLPSEPGRGVVPVLGNAAVAATADPAGHLDDHSSEAREEEEDSSSEIDPMLVQELVEEESLDEGFRLWWYRLLTD